MPLSIDHIAWAGAVVAAIALATGYGVLRRWFDRPRLSRREREVIAAAADAFFPLPLPRSGVDAGAVTYMAVMFERGHRPQRRMFRLLFLFTELSPVLFALKRPFSLLSDPARLEVLDAASRSSIYLRRVAFIALRTLLTMAYFADHEVQRALGILNETDPFGLAVQDEGVPPPRESHERLKVPSEKRVAS